MSYNIRMKGSNVTTDIIVGLFVLAGLAAVAVLAIQVSGGGEFRRDSDSYQLSAWFDNVGQLKVGAPVRMAGVDVGHVAAIGMDNKRYQARVELRVGKDFEFPLDTSAAIYTSGLLGEQYVGLEPGGEELMLAAGDPIEITSGAVVLEDLIGKFLFSKATEQ